MQALHDLVFSHYLFYGISSRVRSEATLAPSSLFPIMFFREYEPLNTLNRGVPLLLWALLVQMISYEES